jgi:hypothetical protein
MMTYILFDAIGEVFDIRDIDKSQKHNQVKIDDEN